MGSTKNDEGDGYQAAMVNFRFMAHALWTTQEAVTRMHQAAGTKPAAGKPMSAA